MLVYNSPVRANAKGEELYGHGTAGFPCGCYYNDPLVSEVPWHWHAEYEVVVVTYGELVYLAGGESHHLRAGDAAFVNAGVPHAERAWEGSHAVEGDLVFHPRLLWGTTDSDVYTRYLSRLEAPGAPAACALRGDGEAWEREAIACIARAHTAVADEERFFEVTAREALTRAVLLVMDNTPRASALDGAAPDPLGMGRVRDMIQFIEDHYAESLSVGEIAAAGGVSEREAQRSFKGALGESPKEYLTSHRLFVASQMLKSTDATAGQVARDCGFASQSYFARRFRERYGHTPSEHRRMG